MTLLSPEQSAELRAAYIRRLALAVMEHRREDASDRAMLAVTTATPEEVEEATILSDQYDWLVE